jgi:hypothetical protein
MCIGNLGAILQTNVKRMLAYSSIAHAGYLMVAFASASNRELGISAAMFYSAAYAAMNVGAFAVITHMVRQRRALLADRRLLGTRQALAGAGRRAHLLPALAHRNSHHRRILRQVLRLQRRPAEPTSSGSPSSAWSTAAWAPTTTCASSCACTCTSRDTELRKPGAPQPAAAPNQPTRFGPSRFSRHGHRHQPALATLWLGLDCSPTTSSSKRWRERPGMALLHNLGEHHHQA